MDQEYQRLLDAMFKIKLKDGTQIHKHCFTCYSFTQCSAISNSSKSQSCDFVKCPSHCGAIFHGCKLKEHNEICPNVTVTCINQSLGCPVEMLRKDINLHLAKCPASVVVSLYCIFKIIKC